MGHHRQAKLAGPGQNTHEPRIVDVHALIDGVELDTRKAHVRDPLQLFRPVLAVGMDGGEGRKAVPLLVHPGGSLVHVSHLMWVGGYRHDHGQVDARLLHRGPQAVCRAVGKRTGVAGGTELFHSGRSDPVGKYMGVKVDDHGNSSSQISEELQHTDKVYHSSSPLKRFTCDHPGLGSWAPGPFPRNRRRHPPPVPCPALP